MALLPGVVRELLTHEENAFRFELVAPDLCGASEGAQFVPTSRSRDLGRDARRFSLGDRQIPGVVCATLRADLDPKVAEDLARLTKTTKTKAILYCSTQPLTDQAVDTLEAVIRTRFRDLDSVRVLGRTQLEYLGERFEEIIRRHYAGEILNIEETLLRSPLSERPHPVDDPQQAELARQLPGRPSIDLDHLGGKFYGDPQPVLVAIHGTHLTPAGDGHRGRDLEEAGLRERCWRAYAIHYRAGGETSDRLMKPPSTVYLFGHISREH